jgi:hypothetical protein
VLKHRREIDILTKDQEKDFDGKDSLQIKLLIDYVPINKYILASVFLIIILIFNITSFGVHQWIFSGYLLEVFIALSICYGTDFVKSKWLSTFIEELNMPVDIKKQIIERILNKKVRILFLIIISIMFIGVLIISQLHPYYNTSKSIILLIIFSIMLLGFFVPIMADALSLLFSLIFLVIKNRDHFQFNAYDDDMMGGTKNGVEHYIKNSYLFILIILAIITYIWIIALNLPETISEYSINLDLSLFVLYFFITVLLLVTLVTYPAINSFSLINFKNNALRELNLKISQYHQRFSIIITENPNQIRNEEVSPELFKKILQLEVLRNQRIFVSKIRSFLIDSKAMTRIMVTVAGILISYFLNIAIKNMFF